MLVEAVIVTFAAPPIDTAQNPANSASGRLHYEIARQLDALGLKRGDQVAIVTGDFPYYWARLAGVRITMEVSFGDKSYSSAKQRETQWAKAREILSSRGTRFVVSSGLSGIVDQPDWQELGHTGIFACRLRSSP